MRVQFLLLGISSLTMGVALLLRYKDWSRIAAEQMKASHYAERFKFDYSERFFRGLYILGGVLLVITGLLLSAEAIDAETSRVVNQIKDSLAYILVVLAFCGGLSLIIYSCLWFSKRRDGT